MVVEQVVIWGSVVWLEFLCIQSFEIRVQDQARQRVTNYKEKGAIVIQQTLLNYHTVIKLY